MFNSITLQIKKLDKDIDGCKERLHAIKKTHTKNIDKCFRLGKIPVKFNRAMNKKKVSSDREHELNCKKHRNYSRLDNELPKKGKGLDSICNKKSPRVKRRSRSVSCGRDCDCSSETKFLYNDLETRKQDNQLKHKNSWANVLKEHNRHVGRKSHSSNTEKEASDYSKYAYPTSIYVRNKGIQCSEPLLIPSKTNFSEPGFTLYNPTKTLLFLMSEIKDNLKLKREDKLMNIVNSMEDVIFRLNSNYEPPSYESKSNSNLNINQQPMNNNNRFANQDMNKILEEGFSKLESTCKSLELTCATLKAENNQLQLEIQKRDGIISSLEHKDKDNFNKIDLLNKHIFMMNKKEDEFTQANQDLTKLVNKLQLDNKCIEPLKEINSRLDGKLSAMLGEKDGTIYKNQILKLENEKLKVLLDMKEKQLSKFKEVFLGLEDRVKTEVNVMQGRCVTENSSSDTSAPLCSSPNSSGSIMAPAYESWRGVSRVSTNADSTSPFYPPNFHPAPSVNIANKIASGLNHELCKGDSQSGVPLQCALQMPPKVEIPHIQMDGVANIRGQIKKMFTDEKSQSKLGNHHWTNLSSGHSSVTSYNTTT